MKIVSRQFTCGEKREAEKREAMKLGSLEDGKKGTCKVK